MITFLPAMKFSKLFYLTSALVLLTVNGKRETKRQVSFGIDFNKGTADACTTATGDSGTCKRLKDCQIFYSKLQTGNHSPELLDLIRRSNCRYEGSDPIVCCPGGSTNTPPSQVSRLSQLNTVSPQSCGKRSIDSERIVNGVPAKKGAWPWIAALGYSAFGGRLDFLCGGALITNRHILTAAHCVINRLDLSVVRLGSHNLQNDPVGTFEEIKISERLPHEKYDKTSFENDIAILTLERPAEFKETINPVCLPTGSFFRNTPLENLFGAITGWGAIDYEGPRSAVLLEARVPIRTNDECKRSYSVFDSIVIDDRTICAGNGLSDTCQGDSGGPLMVYDPNTMKYNIAGVVSVGYKCAEKGFPGIYTRVTSYIDWIQKNTQ